MRSSSNIPREIIIVRELRRINLIFPFSSRSDLYD